ncbi:unknown [Fusobacterium sp. CAG:439]|nr:unknown [Fusobacterium sp. CAG:439]
MEVEKAKIERDKQIAELKKKYEQIQLDCKNAIIQTENNIETLNLIDKNLENLRRLNTNGVVARSECIKKTIRFAGQKT